jgi:hypothetical protein
MFRQIAKEKFPVFVEGGAPAIRRCALKTNHSISRSSIELRIERIRASMVGIGASYAPPQFTILLPTCRELN